MSHALKISIGQHSDKGRKEINQDFHGVLIPHEPLLTLKGIAAVVCDGIGSSDVSHIASESAAKGFLTDYYCTSDAWPVKTSAQRVISATNSWLHSQTQGSRYPYDKDKGYVCTLSAIVLKSVHAHIFHIGDSRIYRIAGQSLEQLTNDHRVALSESQSYLSRALGVGPQVEIDYRMIPLETGDVFLLATDGAYEYVGGRFVIDAIDKNALDLDSAARDIVDEAYRRGSPDNLTVQIVRIDALPDPNSSEAFGQASDLPLPPLLEARIVFDGYRVIRELHVSSRSHIYLAVDIVSEQLVVIKIPSIDMRNDPAYLKRFMMEEWVARRINSAHVLKPCIQSRKRNYLYVATEFIDGQTLTQWMVDNRKPPLEPVRKIIEQIANGLQAFHRMGMLHQDLRPDNVMIDSTGTVKIIDFGSTKVGGIVEIEPDADGSQILGTVQYAAPEYFLGTGGTASSDIFSLGVIAYQMLTGQLPYGTAVAKTKTKLQQMKLKYRSAIGDNREIPLWLDSVLERAVQVDPAKRYEELSEFIYDLRHPNQNYLGTYPKPLLERNPFLFWQLLCMALVIMVLVLLLNR
jgi:serine/threonine protein kinase